MPEWPPLPARCGKAADLSNRRDAHPIDRSATDIDSGQCLANGQLLILVPVQGRDDSDVSRLIVRGLLDDPPQYRPGTDLDALGGAQVESCLQGFVKAYRVSYVFQPIRRSHAILA